MASSGWQGSQYIYTVYSEIWGNLRIDGITHSGTDLRVWGALRVEGKGSGCSYFNNGIHGYTESQSDALIVGGGVNVCSGNTFDRSFDVTIHNVSTSTTSYNFDAYFYACNANNCSSKYFDVRLRWTISFSASGSGPSGAAVEYISSTWKSVKIKSSVSSWGSGYSGTPNLEQIVVLPTATTSNWKTTGRQVLKNATSSLTNTNTVTNNNSISFDGGLTIKGASKYKVAAYASTNIGSTDVLDNTIIYTPPAPGQLTYVIDPNDDSKQTITYVGVPANNATDYTQSLLTRTVRYKGQNDANWTYIENDTQIALDASTTQLINIPAGTTTAVEAWMTYNGLKSQVSKANLTNNQDPVYLYCSMGNKAERIEKLYGAVVPQSTPRQLLSINSVETNEYASVPRENYALLKAGLLNSPFPLDVKNNPTYNYLDISLYRYSGVGTGYQLYTHLKLNQEDGSSPSASRMLISSSSFQYFVNGCAAMGIIIDPSYEDSPLETHTFLDIDAEFGYPAVAKKIKKLYASVNGVTKLIYRDSS